MISRLKMKDRWIISNIKSTSNQNVSEQSTLMQKILNVINNIKGLQVDLDLYISLILLLS